MKTYKGYSARIEYDARDNILVGHIDGISDIIGFHTTSVADIEAAFHEAVDDYLAMCADFGKEPQRPANGNVMLRMAPAIHSAALSAARTAGQSLNKWVEALVARETGVEPQGKTARHSRSSHAPRATRRREAA